MIICTKYINNDVVACPILVNNRLRGNGKYVVNVISMRFFAMKTEEAIYQESVLIRENAFSVSTTLMAKRGLLNFDNYLRQEF